MYFELILALGFCKKGIHLGYLINFWLYFYPNSVCNTTMYFKIRITWNHLHFESHHKQTLSSKSPRSFKSQFRPFSPTIVWTVINLIIGFHWLSNYQFEALMQFKIWMVDIIYTWKAIISKRSQRNHLNHLNHSSDNFHSSDNSVKSSKSSKSQFRQFSEII